MRRHFIKYIYSGIFSISFFLCLKIAIPSPAESIDTLDREIIKKYQKIILEEPSNLNAHFNLGILYYRNALFDEAVREFRKVLDINPNDSEAYYNLGNVFNKKNLFDDAIDSYKKPQPLIRTMQEFFTIWGTLMLVRG